MNQIFDIKRIYKYTRLKLEVNKKLIVLSVSGFFGFAFIVTFFIANFSANHGTYNMINTFHMGTFVFMLFAGIVILAGRTFHDMNSQERSIAQLMLPISTFERFLLHVLTSSAGWIIISFVSYELFALFTNFIWSSVFNISIDTFYIFNNVSTYDAVKVLESLFFIHSIFFLGAGAIKKYPMAKTALYLFVVNSVFTFATMFFILILFGSFENFALITGNFYDNYLSEELLLKVGEYSEYVFIIFIPLVLYVVSYFKLKEREV